MTDHAFRLMSAIASACSEYRNGKIDLAELQARIAPVVSALDEASTEVRAALRQLTAQLESIRFMYGEHEQRPEVLQEIAVIQAILPDVFQVQAGAIGGDGG